MKHKYLLIESGRVVDETTRIYQIWIGSGKQADRDYLAIMANAVSCGYYFQLWSDKVCEFLDKLLQHYHFDTPIMSVQARDYVRAMKANLRQPLSAACLSNQHHLRNAVNLQYFMAGQLNRKKSSASV